MSRMYTPEAADPFFRVRSELRKVHPSSRLRYSNQFAKDVRSQSRLELHTVALSSSASCHHVIITISIIQPSHLPSLPLKVLILCVNILALIHSRFSEAIIMNFDNILNCFLLNILFKKNINVVNKFTGDCRNSHLQSALHLN